MKRLVLTSTIGGDKLIKQSLHQENQRLREQVASLESQLESLAGRQDAGAETSNDVSLRALVDTAAVAILVVDRQMRIVLSNPKLEAMFGYTREEFENMPLERLLPERLRDDHEGRMARFFLSPRDRPMGHGLDLVALRRDGDEFPVEISLSVVGSGAARRVVAFIVDITARQYADGQRRLLVREQERVAAIKQVIGQIAHDFRSPLSIISSRIYLLKRELTEKSLDHVVTLEREVERLNRLIEAMMIMAELDAVESLTLTHVNLNSLLIMTVNSLSDFAEAREHNVSTEFSEGLTTVAANQDMLYLALRHLLRNALQFTPNGGAITVTSAYEAPYAVVAIHDTGAGIAEDDLPHIFERFFRVDLARGSDSGYNGLGLAIVKRIIELHEGRIEVDSEIEQGSEFRVYLPVYDRPRDQH